MKKVLFSVLMISVFLMIASCGSKSDSGEASEVEFADPAILQEGKVDVTGYFSAESVSKPSVNPVSFLGNTYYPIKTSVKLKVLKSLADLKFDDDQSEHGLAWTAELCDENETVIAEARTQYETPMEEVKSYEEGRILVLNFSTYNRDYWDRNDSQSKASKIKKVRIRVEAR